MVEYKEVAVGYRVGSDSTFWSRRRRGPRGPFDKRMRDVPLMEEWVDITPKITSKKYAVVSIDGKLKQFHVLLLETFVGPKPTRTSEARHLNDIKSDNRLENLAWGTRKQNAEDACRNGRLPTKLTALTARLAVLLCRKCGWSAPHAAKYFKVATGTIHSVLSGKTWSHATRIPYSK